MLFTFTEDALQISTATHKDTSCACSNRSSKAPSLLGSLTNKLFSQGRGPGSDPGNSETRRLPVLKPNMLSRSLVGDWLLPTPMPCVREFKKCTGWTRKNKSWKKQEKIVILSALLDLTEPQTSRLQGTRPLGTRTISSPEPTLALSSGTGMSRMENDSGQKCDACAFAAKMLPGIWFKF